MFLTRRAKKNTGSYCRHSDHINQAHDVLSSFPAFSAMREQYMRTGEGFLLVYSITSRNSFEEISTFHQQILRVKDKDSFPVIVVANKCDLEFERQVGMNGTFIQSLTSVGICLSSTAEGRDLAKHFGCRFIETSAKQRINVDEAFSNLVREIRKYNKVRCIYVFDRVPASCRPWY